MNQDRIVWLESAARQPGLHMFTGKTVTELLDEVRRLQFELGVSQAMSDDRLRELQKRDAIIEYLQSRK